MVNEVVTDHVRVLSKFFQLLLLACLGWMTLTFAASSSEAKYIVQPGDELEIAVAGVSELKQTAKVGIDGNISLLLVGEVNVAGKSLDEIRQQIRSLLSSKVLQNATGEQQTHIAFSPDDIKVDIATYRPIYVMGDVAKPGELPYRPKMTVQQAVALAGGYDLLRGGREDPVLQSADLRAEYETLWIELTRERIRIERIKAELNDKKLDSSSWPEAPIAKSTADELAATEQNALNVHQELKDKENVFYKALKQHTEQQLTALENQSKNDEETAKIDSEEAARVAQLASKGVATLTRLSDVKRSVLLSQTRLLQTNALRDQVRRDQVELDRSKTRIDNTRSDTLTQELQDANVKLATTMAKLRAVGEKLLYTTALKSQLVQGKERAPKFVVTRKVGSASTKKQVEEGFELDAGDTVEVTLSVDLASWLQPD
jgi:polysaccharide export outer membrane protein